MKSVGEVMSIGRTFEIIQKCYWGHRHSVCVRNFCRIGAGRVSYFSRADVGKGQQHGRMDAGKDSGADADRATGSERLGQQML